MKNIASIGTITPTSSAAARSAHLPRPPSSEALNPRAYSRAEVEQIQALAECRATASASHPRAPDGRLRLTARVAGNGLNFLVIEPDTRAETPLSVFSLDTSDRLSYPLLRHSVLKRGGEMARTSQDVTEAELAVLRRLWERGPATIRQLVEDVYGQDGTSAYATVQKLLDRLEAKGFVARDRSGAVHVFRAAVERDELIGRRLRAVADTLCGGSLTPLLTHLVQGRRLSDQQRQALRGAGRAARSRAQGVNAKGGRPWKRCCAWAWAMPWRPVCWPWRRPRSGCLHEGGRRCGMGSGSSSS